MYDRLLDQIKLSVNTSRQQYEKLDDEALGQLCEAITEAYEPFVDAIKRQVRKVAHEHGVVVIVREET